MTVGVPLKGKGKRQRRLKLTHPNAPKFYRLAFELYPARVVKTFMARFCVLVFWLAMTPLTAARAAASSAPPIDVVLWFDTEDYLSPSDDDAAKRLADLLTARQIRATFKVVGEKA